MNETPNHETTDLEFQLVTRIVTRVGMEEKKMLLQVEVGSYLKYTSWTSFSSDVKKYMLCEVQGTFNDT